MKTFKKEIFGQLGNLFYALAMDQNISILGSGELKMAVKKDWLTGTDDDPPKDQVSEAAHVMGLAIDSLQSQQVSSVEAYGDFEEFYRDHKEQFSHALKQNILETAEAILKIFPTTGERNEHFQSLGRLFKTIKGSPSPG